MIDQARERLQPTASGDYEVWPDNWHTVTFFCGLRTQWTYVGSMAAVHRVGLDYAGVESAMRMQGMARSRRAALFEELQLMEAAALEVWHAKA